MANSKDVRTNVRNESGRLLWVRRRNGTWWPGQIVSPDQVPESYMSFRRSDTPIKLLGKQDAIVEWINIETSNRVKAFRCGEFDACIEEAKASANSDKRPSKYARRRDAILQALQLEDEQNSEDKPQGVTEPSFPLVPDEVDHKVEGWSELWDNSDLGHELFHYGVSSQDTKFEEQITLKRKSSPKGVEELGVGLASKRVRQVEAQCVGPQHYIGSGLDTSGAATAVSLATSIETDVKPALYLAGSKPDMDPESCALPEPCGGTYDSLNLFDVKMEVQTSYIAQDVPFTCAESGLNGHSIVGHPPNIEVLLDDVPKSEVEDMEKSVLHCVPLSRIFSRLRAALRY